MNRNKLKRPIYYVMRTDYNGKKHETLKRFNSIERAKEYINLFSFPGNPHNYEIWEEGTEADILKVVIK